MLLATELPSFYLSMGGKGGKKFGPRRIGRPRGIPGPKPRNGLRRLPPKKVAARKVAKKKVASKKAANENDDDQVDTGESHAPAAENPIDDANIVFDEDDNDDKSFVPVAAQKVVMKGDGFDEFGKPDPSFQNDADQVDTGESSAPATANPSDDAIVFDEDDNDDSSFVQVAAQKVVQKGDGFDDFGTPDPNFQNDADQVEAVEPRRSCRSQKGCGKIFCLVCYPE